MAHDNDSALRFSLLELDQAPVGQAIGAGPAAARQADPGTVGKAHVAAGEVDQDRAAIARTERELASQLTGLKLSGEAGKGPGATFYDEGTVLLEGSADVAIRSRREWERRPLASDAAAALREIVAAEQRVDVDGVNLSDVRIDHRGRLNRSAAALAPAGLRMTEHSWGQIAGKAPRGSLRNNLNSWLGGSDKKMMMRTRNPDEATGTRELFGALTERYAVWDGADAIATLADRLPREARAELRYNAATTQVGFDASMHNPYMLGGDEVAVGRMHRVGIRLRTSDNGTERYRIRAYVERIRCVNCTLVQADWATIDRKHLGDARAIIEAATALFERAGDVLAEFNEHWTEAAAATAFRDVEGTAQAREAFRKLISSGILDADRLPGVARKDLVDSLVTAWEYEPGGSWQAVQRAVTRAAHTSGFGLETSDALEEQAGELLYNRAWLSDSFDGGLLA